MENSNRIIIGRFLKVAIVLIAAVLLVFALRKFLENEEAVDLLISNSIENLPLLLLVVVLLPVNWFLETAKWKRLISSAEKISWAQAWSAVLAGLAIGSATPNRIGEFAGRIFQLKQIPPRDGIVFTLVSSMMQVLVTITFGVVGLLMTDRAKYLHGSKALMWTIAVIGVLGIGFMILKSSRGKIADYFSALRKIKFVVLRDVALLSAFRYLIYSAQFFLMLKICGVPSTGFELCAAIAVNYLVVTIVPSVIFSEMIVRGTVATGVIGGLCGNPGAAALAAIILWMINIGLPAVVGLFFIKNLSFFGRK